MAIFPGHRERARGDRREIQPHEARECCSQGVLDCLEAISVRFSEVEQARDEVFAILSGQ